MKTKNRPKKEKPCRKPRAFKQKIHFPDGVWSWEMSGGRIRIRDPEGNQFLTDQSKLTGVTWDELERAQYKGYSGRYSILPSTIRDYIEKNLKKLVRKVC